MHLIQFRRWAPAFLAAVLVPFVALPAAAFDRAGYQSRVEAVAKEIVVGKFADFDAALKRLDEAAAIAAVAAKERAAAAPSDA
jgi:hypothetical protein